MRDFSHETKMVIRHLQKAMLDIVDLNLSPQALKDSIVEYLAELLDTGPGYIEEQEERRTLLRLCPPPVAQERDRSPLALAFPFTGQDPRNPCVHPDTRCASAPEPEPLASTEPDPTSPTPERRALDQCEDDNRPEAEESSLSPFPNDFSDIYPNETRPRRVIVPNGKRRGTKVRRNLFPAKSDDAAGNLSAHIEEFEKYMQKKYSCGEEQRDRYVCWPEGEPVSKVHRAPCTDEVDEKRHSRFEMFLRETGALKQRDGRPPEAKATGEDPCQLSKFEKHLLRERSAGHDPSSSGSSDDDSFIREMLRVNWPPKNS